MAVEVSLPVLRKANDPSYDRFVTSLVKSDNVELRTIAAWHLAHAAADGGSLSPEIDAAIEPLIAANVSRVTFEALGFELLARASHRPRHERRWTDLAQDTGRKPYWLAEQGRSFVGLLSDQEIDDIASVAHRTRGSMVPRPPPRGMSKLVVSQPSTELGVRTVPLGGGLLSELLKLTGCEAKPERMALAEVHYRSDGRPARISIAPGNLPESCVRVAEVMFGLTVARAAKPMPPTFTDILVLPLDPERIACIEDAGSSPPFELAEPSSPLEAVASAMPARVGGTITQPRKIKNVNPVYPPVAYKHRIEGVVIIESTISPAGCVSEATVVSSPDPSLSGAALFAVMGWRYTPTLLNDVAVPVIMTVTVNFTLRR
jgi:TonB family protein